MSSVNEPNNFKTSYSSKFVTNQYATCIDTMHEIQVLGEEEGEDEEEQINSILKDTTLMQSINSKLQNIFTYLESDTQCNAESLFDDIQVLKEDRMASNIICQSNI